MLMIRAPSAPGGWSLRRPAVAQSRTTTVRSPASSGSAWATTSPGSIEECQLVGNRGHVGMPHHDVPPGVAQGPAHREERPDRIAVGVAVGRHEERAGGGRELRGDLRHARVPGSDVAHRDRRHGSSRAGRSAVTSSMSRVRSTARSWWVSKMNCSCGVWRARSSAPDSALQHAAGRLQCLAGGLAPCGVERRPVDLRLLQVLGGAHLGDRDHSQARIRQIAVQGLGDDLAQRLVDAAEPPPGLCQRQSLPTAKAAISSTRRSSRDSPSTSNAGSQ